MNEWIKNIVGYLLIVSVVMQMLPDSKYEQYVRLFTGFLLILLVIRPVLRIGSLDSYLEQKVSEFLTEQEMLEDQIAVWSDAFEKESEEMQITETMVEIKEIEKVRVEVTADD